MEAAFIELQMLCYVKRISLEKLDSRIIDDG